MRTGRKQTGQFDVQPGMAFIMKDMNDLIPWRAERSPGNNPWLVTTVDDDYVEVVMCSLMPPQYDNKHRYNSLRHDDVTDIQNGCPPISNDRDIKASLSTFMVFPKKELFSHQLSLLNDNTKMRNFQREGTKSLCISEDVLNNIRDEINEYMADHSKYNCDPFKCMEMADYQFELENGGDVPQWFTKHTYEMELGWNNLPSADMSAAYPFEDQMHPYEQADKDMVQTVRNRDHDRVFLTVGDLANIPIGNDTGIIK